MHVGIQKLTILHTDIHTLSSFGRVCMNGITCEEDTVALRKFITHALSNLVRSPPVAIRVVELIWVHDTLSRFQDDLGSDPGPVSFGAILLAICRLKLDIESNKFILTGNDHQATRIRRVDGASMANIWEIRDGDNVEYTPDIIG